MGLLGAWWCVRKGPGLSVLGGGRARALAGALRSRGGALLGGGRLGRHGVRWAGTGARCRLRGGRGRRVGIGVGVGGQHHVIVPADRVLAGGRARALRQLLPRLVRALQAVQPAGAPARLSLGLGLR